MNKESKSLMEMSTKELAEAYEEYQRLVKIDKTEKDEE